MPFLVLKRLKVFLHSNENMSSLLFTAITIGVRILGPALGFIVGSLCTSVYADLSVDPKIDITDPRWIGAWWLGIKNINDINLQYKLYYC